MAGTRHDRCLSPRDRDYLARRVCLLDRGLLACLPRLDQLVDLLVAANSPAAEIHQRLNVLVVVLVFRLELQVRFGLLLGRESSRTGGHVLSERLPGCGALLIPLYEFTYQGIILPRGLPNGLTQFCELRPLFFVQGVKSIDLSPQTPRLENRQVLT